MVLALFPLPRALWLHNGQKYAHTRGWQQCARTITLPQHWLPAIFHNCTPFFLRIVVGGVKLLIVALFLNDFFFYRCLQNWIFNNRLSNVGALPSFPRAQIHTYIAYITSSWHIWLKVENIFRLPLSMSPPNSALINIFAYCLSMYVHTYVSI